MRLTLSLGVCGCVRWNSWNHFYCGINEQIIRETGTLASATSALFSTQLISATHGVTLWSLQYATYRVLVFFSIHIALVPMNTDPLQYCCCWHVYLVIYINDIYSRCSIADNPRRFPMCISTSGTENLQPRQKSFQWSLDYFSRRWLNTLI